MITIPDGTAIPQSQESQQSTEHPESQPTTHQTGLHAVSPGATDWRSRLIMTGDDNTGRPDGGTANVIIALTYCPAWDGVIAYDKMASAVVMRRCPPWRDPSAWPSDPYYTSPWRDTDDTRTIQWLQHEGIRATHVRDEIKLVAHEHSFHPLRDYLNSLVWDGEERIDWWLSIYLGVENTNNYITAVSAKFLISAVARVMEPGCKVDTCLVLEGDQGQRKSTALRTLAGGKRWFMDDLPDIRTKEAIIQLQSKWIIELSELSAMKGMDRERVKSFLSRWEDRYRTVYGHESIDAPRQCVFAGTTNHHDWNDDETGGRRFWPVRTGVTHDIDIEGLAEHRDQLWAEAVHRYKAGDKWWLTERDEIALAKAEQRDRHHPDAWENRINTFLLHQQATTVNEILSTCLSKELAACNQHDVNRVAKCLVVLGWQKCRNRVNGKREYRYERKPVG